MAPCRSRPARPFLSPSCRGDHRVRLSPQPRRPRDPLRRRPHLVSVPPAEHFSFAAWQTHLLASHVRLSRFWPSRPRAHPEYLVSAHKTWRGLGWVYVWCTGQLTDTGHLCHTFQFQNKIRFI